MRLTFLQYAWNKLLFQIDRIRMKFGWLPVLEIVAGRMGRRAGIFLHGRNPFLPEYISIRYSAVMIYDRPVLLEAVRPWPESPYGKNWGGGDKIEGPARAWQLARNQAVWDFHMKPEDKIIYKYPA